MTEDQVQIRLWFFKSFILILFALIFGRLWWLQIVQRTTYQGLADVNRFRPVEINAPRGIIYDRHGELLVRNRPIFDVVIVPAFLPDDPTLEAQIYARLSALLQLPITNAGEREIPNNNAYYRSFAHHEYTRLPNRQVDRTRSRRLSESPQGIKDAVQRANIFAPYRPVLVAEDIDPQVASTIEEDHLNLPSVLINIRSEREYLTAELTAHVIGYVGPIPAGQEANYPAPDYNPNDQVGLIGIEARYEDWLHGVKGLETTEVDVTGRPIGPIGDIIPAKPGNNLVLTLDLNLQTLLTERLQEAIDQSGGQSAAGIVMNPQNGEILAIASLPSYDNNLFTQGISARAYRLLSEDEQTPLINRAISGVYPPGSTFKIVISAGTLEEKTVTPEQAFFDTGILYLPNRFFPDDLDLAQPFFCWLRTGHGFVDAITALAHSCDVYYYQVGGGYEPNEYEGLGITRIIQYTQRFGFGQLTGIDLPGESTALVPTPRWKRLNYAEIWVTGDTYNLSIGQGYALATPLQILNSFAAIANGGTLYKPYLTQRINSPQREQLYRAQPEVIGTLNLRPDTLSTIREGLVGVIDFGTAKNIIDLSGISVAGKTGTAEFCDDYPECLDADGRVKTSHAWFVAYAPVENPEIAAIAFVYDGGEGSLTAAPVVNSVFSLLFWLGSIRRCLSHSERRHCSPKIEYLDPKYSIQRTFFRGRYFCWHIAGSDQRVYLR